MTLDDLETHLCCSVASVFAMTSMLIVNHVLKISIVFAVAVANIVNDPWKMCCLVYTVSLLAPHPCVQLS